MGEEAVYWMVVAECACDLPFFFQGDGQGFGSQFFYDIMYIVLVFFRIVRAGAVNKQAAGFQSIPYIVDDASLAGGTKVDVRHAPLAGAVGIFAEHSFAGTGHVGDDHIKQMGEAADLFGIIIDYDVVRIAPFGDVLSQDITAAADHFVADQQATFGQGA